MIIILLVTFILKSAVYSPQLPKGERLKQRMNSNNLFPHAVYNISTLLP